MNLPKHFSPTNKGFTFILRRVNPEASGFTLIELLIVIAIIGILLGLGISNYQRAQQNARDSRRAKDLSEVKNALEAHFQNELAYPAEGTNGQINCDTDDKVWGDEALRCNSQTYMNILPRDPGFSPEYCYSSTGTDNFAIYAEMENDVHNNLDPPETCNGESYDYKLVNEP